MSALRSLKPIALALPATIVLGAAPAVGKTLVDKPTGFRAKAPADFRLAVHRGAHRYDLSSPRRHVGVTYRVVRTHAAPSRLVRRAGGPRRARARRLSAGRVGLAVFHGRLNRRSVRMLSRVASSIVAPKLSFGFTSPVSLRWVDPSGSTVSGNAHFEVSASTPAKVRNVAFYVDGVRRQVEVLAPYEATVDTRTLKEGSHLVTAIATQSDSRTVSVTKTIKVANKLVAPTTTPTPTPTTTTPAPTTSTGGWTANFAAARTNCGFDDAGFDPYSGGGDYPFCPGSVGIAAPSADGVPAPPNGAAKIAHFAVSEDDAKQAQPRYMAKLFKPFYAPGYDDKQQDQHHTRPPADVSGTYSAWYYLPADFTIPGTGWRNIFQFKERYWDGQESGYTSVPTWWMVLYNGDGKGTPTATINYWNNGNAGGVGEDVVVPRGRWFEVKAVIRQGVSIDWYLDGKLMGTGSNSTWTVGPSHGSQSLAWNFGVGNYAGAGGSGRWEDRISAPIYMAGATYKP